MIQTGDMLLCSGMPAVQWCLSGYAGADSWDELSQTDVAVNADFLTWGRAILESRVLRAACLAAAVVVTITTTCFPAWIPCFCGSHDTSY